MKIKNFKVVSQEIRETQQGEINGNTVELNFSYGKNQSPMYISFSVMRGKEGDENYTGQTVISGSVGMEGNIDTKFHEKRKRSDFMLINEIWGVCDGIINPITDEEDTTEESSK